MKSLYESLLTGKVNKPSAKVVPGSKEELQQIIAEHIKRIKLHPGQEVDLNWIDISQIDDLDFVFANTNYIPVIDTWEIDHVKDFGYMFSYNEHIVRSPIPVLQEKLLFDSCYIGMFMGCTNLKEPPALPAKKLIKSCYASMFEGCSSLVEPPELPAKNLVPRCYEEMFKNCSSLKAKAKMPKGPVPDIFTAQDMYKGCPNIK